MPSLDALRVTYGKFHSVLLAAGQLLIDLRNVPHRRTARWLREPEHCEQLEEAAYASKNALLDLIAGVDKAQFAVVDEFVRVTQRFPRLVWAAHALESLEALEAKASSLIIGYPKGTDVDELIERIWSFEAAFTRVRTEYILRGNELDEAEVASAWAFGAGKVTYKGTEFELFGKPYEVLKATVLNGGEISSRALLDSIWRGEEIEEASIKNHVFTVRSVLRKAISGCPKDPFPCVDRGRNLAWRLCLESEKSEKTENKPARDRP